MVFQVCYRVRKTLFYQLSLYNVAIQILFLIKPHDCTNASTLVTVTIDQGILKGAKSYTDEGNEYFEFICIPYAQPPVGNLRFKSPQPPEPWKGVKDATIARQDHVAAQLNLYTFDYVGSEDCLYLNVYTPKLPNNGANSELLPVMLQIHGGGFLFGNGIIKDESGPDYLINNNVVVVTINYRLGIFGFLSLDMPEAAGNMGLKDQVQALIWVQNNIEKFGGDKKNVTIGGISAGAASVEYHMLSPKSKGLFHKGILQSGSSLNHWAINFEPQKLLNDVLRHLGFQGNVENQQAIYEYLLTCPTALLIEASSAVIQESFPEGLFFGFVPTIERDFGNGESFLTDSPYKLLKNGNFHKVPVVKGFCEMEGYMMNLVKPSAVTELAEDKNFTKHLAYSMNTIEQSSFNKRFAKTYDTSIENPMEEDDIIDFFSDYDFISGIWISGHIMSDYGVDVYLYKFSYDGKMNFLKNMFGIHRKGAFHADDIAYVFKTEISKLANETDIIVRDKVTKLWTNFAKSSNPDQPVPVNGNFSTWPPLNQYPLKYLNIDAEFTIKTYQDTAKMDIFKELYELSLKNMETK